MYKKLFKIAIPIAIQHFLMTANSMLDNFMIIKLGDSAIAALGSCASFISVAKLLLLGITSGNAILTSQYSANQDEKGMDRSFIFSCLISLFFALCFALYYFIFRESIIASFSSDTIIQTMAQNYLDICIVSILVFALLFPRMVSLRSRGVVNFPFIMTIALLVTNFSLNYLLIFGNFGFPKLGIKGAAIATLSSEVAVTLLSYFLASAMGMKVIHNFQNFKKLSLNFMKRYILLSTPLILSNGLWGGFLMLIHITFGQLGSAALSAYGVLKPVQDMVSYLFSGFGSATLIIVGGELGRERFTKAYIKARDISIIGATLAAALGSIIFIANDFLISNLYPGLGLEISFMVKEMVEIFAMFLWVRIFNSISMNGIFRSGGDSIFIFTAVSITSWLVTLPLVYAGKSYFGWNYREIYWAINFSEVLLALIFVVRFRSKKWMKNLSKRG